MATTTHHDNISTHSRPATGASPIDEKPRYEEDLRERDMEKGGLDTDSNESAREAPREKPAGEEGIFAKLPIWYRKYYGKHILRGCIATLFTGSVFHPIDSGELFKGSDYDMQLVDHLSCQTPS